MKTTAILTLFLYSLSNLVSSQDYAHDYTIELSANVTSSSITLNWEDNLNTTPDTYAIYRRVLGGTSWGVAMATVGSTILTYTDNTITEDVSYEYKVEKTLNGQVHAWGYMNSAVDLELEPNLGDILLVVDSTFVSSLSTEISQLESDLYREGWRVSTIYVDRNATAAYVKTRINTSFSTLSDLNTVYLFGHVPVPYSGELYPDAHTNHIGAWPADVYYADLNGNWTDFSVNNTSASDSRNHNVPGDGKFDQSQVISKLELEVSRVDFHGLTNFTDTEEDLLRNYLNKAHNFKTTALTAIEKGLVDQGNFAGYQEGFAQNGFRNFAPMFGASNVDEVDYFSTLDNGTSYLWSYGCGGGSYTSANGLNGGAQLTSAHLAGGHVNTIFTMLFGSYFGDWDKDNNLMRTCLASGDVLSISWAGRPNWHYHTMAMGNHIGKSAKMSMDYNTDYWSIGLTGLVTGEGVHVALLGDPSLRMYYLAAPTGTAVSNLGYAEINWNASSDGTIDGYNVYRKGPGSDTWLKLNSSIITGLSYNDFGATDIGTHEYLVKSVKLKTNASGSFYNESLGDEATYDVNLSINDIELEIALYPNPTIDGNITVESSTEIENYKVYSLSGALVSQQNVNQARFTLTISAGSGMYLIECTDVNGVVVRKRVVVK